MMMLMISGGDLVPSLGGRTKFSRTKISEKFSWRKFLMTFFSHRPGFSDFLFLFPDFTMLNVVYDPFLTRKTPFFYSVHTFARIRQPYFSKYWGDGCMGRPHLKFEGRPPVPPRSPPLATSDILNLPR